MKANDFLFTEFLNTRRAKQESGEFWDKSRKNFAFRSIECSVRMHLLSGLISGSATFYWKLQSTDRIQSEKGDECNQYVSNILFIFPFLVVLGFLDKPDLAIILCIYIFLVVTLTKHGFNFRILRMLQILTSIDGSIKWRLLYYELFHKQLNCLLVNPKRVIIWHFFLSSWGEKKSEMKSSWKTHRYVSHLFFVFNPAF